METKTDKKSKGHGHSHYHGHDAHIKTDESLTEDFGKFEKKGEMKWVSLHHHSTFSFQDGFGMPDTHVLRAAELGMGAMALTEHGNVSSHVKLEMAAEKAGIKPIFGCEVYTGDVDEELRTQRKNHLTILAKDQDGYQNLLRLVSQGWSDFYYEPTVSGETLRRYARGLVVLSGCTGSLLATSLVGGKNVPPEDASYKRGKTVARRFKNSLGSAYFLEVQAFPELDNVCQINQMMERLSEELKIPLVATMDIHYTKPSEAEMQIILHSVRAGSRTAEETAREWGYDVPLAHPNTDKTVFKRLVATGMSKKAAREAVRNAGLIAQDMNVVLPKLPQLRYPLPDEYKSTEEAWLDGLRQGWHYRRIAEKTNRREYKERLRYEMSIIEEKDFTDYFLIVSDLVRFAKDSGIPVGPARGSAAASLVCYLLRITEVDPLQHSTLVFERFIDISRQDLPDIDLDFDSERRSEIRDYLVSRYGESQVGNIGTFTNFRSKNSLDDVARVHKIPKYQVEKVKDKLIERSSGDLRADATIEDTADMFEDVAAVFSEHPELYKAMDLEGNIKAMSTHAAGIVISNGPITDVAAMYQREVGGETLQVVSLDKWDTERQGLLKIDVLGLATMTMISDALLELNMTLEELYAIPLDDPKVIDGFRQNDVVGIFQFDGRAMRGVNAELKPDNFEEICDVNALARPGPLHSGSTGDYIDAKWGRNTPTRYHAMLDDITAHTHYQIVYQEQILKIVTEIGNFDWTHAAYIRKIISKKLGEQEFERQYTAFRDGAASHGIEEDVARAIWSKCTTAGAYAFNAAHCVSYGMLAYWCMWLKVYHPQVFYLSCLRKLPEGDKKKKHMELMKDANRHRIKLLAPHPNKSEISWTIDGSHLRGGFSQVHGIGEKLATRIIDDRRDGGAFKDWDDFCRVPGVGQAKVDGIRAVRESDDPYGIFKLQRQIDKCKAECPSLGLPMPTHTTLQVPYERGQDVECVWLGRVTGRNLRDLFEAHYSRTGEELDPEDVKDPELREWVVLYVEDNEEAMTVTIDRWKYPNFKHAVWGMDPDTHLLLVRGTKKGFMNKRSLYAREIWILNPEG